jgi:hypothetical protein
MATIDLNKLCIKTLTKLDFTQRDDTQDPFIDSVFGIATELEEIGEQMQSKEGPVTKVVQESTKFISRNKYFYFKGQNHSGINYFSYHPTFFPFPPGLSALKYTINAAGVVSIDESNPTRSIFMGGLLPIVINIEENPKKDDGTFTHPCAGAGSPSQHGGTVCAQLVQQNKDKYPIFFYVGTLPIVGKFITPQNVLGHFILNNTANNPVTLYLMPVVFPNFSLGYVVAWELKALEIALEDINKIINSGSKAMVGVDGDIIAVDDWNCFITFIHYDGSTNTTVGTRCVPSI